MENLAARYHDGIVTQEYGMIIKKQDNFYTVVGESGTWQAKPAASCLLSPTTGDKVLITAHPSHPAYILAVLEREQEIPSELNFENDVVVRTQKGTFSLVAKDGLNLVSGGRMQMVSSSELTVHSKKAVIGIEKLSFWGELFDAQVKSIKLLAFSFDSVLERLRQTVKRSYRTIEEMEHIKADRFECTATSLLSLKGKYSIITAKEDVKIDAERIHIG